MNRGRAMPLCAPLAVSRRSARPTASSAACRGSNRPAAIFAMRFVNCASRRLRAHCHPYPRAGHRCATRSSCGQRGFAQAICLPRPRSPGCVARGGGRQGYQRAILLPQQLPAFPAPERTAATLEDAAIFAQLGKSVSPNGDHPRMVGAVITSPNLFQLLGVQPILGRDFVQEDARMPKGRDPELRRLADIVCARSCGDWQNAAHQRPSGHRRRCAAAGMRFPQIALAPESPFRKPQVMPPCSLSRSRRAST